MYQLEILCLNHPEPREWQKCGPAFGTKEQAEEFKYLQMELDAMPPKGRYLYRITEPEKQA